MDRAIPEINRVINKRQLQVAKRIHYKRINSVTRQIDNKKPSALGYPIIKLKKEQLIEERCVEIEKDNRILLERMTKILAGP